MSSSNNNPTGDRRGGLRILIIEDGADSAQTMAILLRLYGHQVSISTDGPAGIEAARKEKPDVLLLDIGLPGMDGHEVARQISQSRRKSGDRQRPLPLLIAVTGFGRESDRRRSAEAGIDLHLLKPVNPTQLESILRSFQSEIDPEPTAP
jgi:CheY-like chemotaxis protein